MKIDEEKGKLEQIHCGEMESKLKIIQIYKIEDSPYPLECVHIYQDNRFISTISTIEKKICGVI